MVEWESTVNEVISNINEALEGISDLVDFYVDSHPQVIRVGVLLKVPFEARATEKRKGGGRDSSPS